MGERGGEIGGLGRSARFSGRLEKGARIADRPKPGGAAEVRGAAWGAPT